MPAVATESRGDAGGRHGWLGQGHRLCMSVASCCCILFRSYTANQALYTFSSNESQVLNVPAPSSSEGSKTIRR
jgi:hypothetical protein